MTEQSMREQCARVAEARAAAEKKYAAAHPGGVELHAMRMAIYNTARGIAAAIRALPLSVPIAGGEQDMSDPEREHAEPMLQSDSDPLTGWQEAGRKP